VKVMPERYVDWDGVMFSGVDMQKRAGLAPLKALNVWRVPRRRRETPWR